MFVPCSDSFGVASHVLCCPELSARAYEQFSELYMCVYIYIYIYICFLHKFRERTRDRICMHFKLNCRIVIEQNCYT